MISRTGRLNPPKYPKNYVQTTSHWNTRVDNAITELNDLWGDAIFDEWYESEITDEMTEEQIATKIEAKVEEVKHDRAVMENHDRRPN